MKNYNPYSSQVFKLDVISDSSENAALVNGTRSSIHPNESMADDNEEAIASDDSSDDDSDES